MKLAKSKHKNDIFAPLPVNDRRPINGGCQCQFCKAHPDRIPQWDAVGIEPETLTQWIVHYPELSE